MVTLTRLTDWLNKIEKSLMLYSFLVVLFTVISGKPHLRVQLPSISNRICGSSSGHAKWLLNVGLQTSIFFSSYLAYAIPARIPGSTRTAGFKAWGWWKAVAHSPEKYGSSAPSGLHLCRNNRLTPPDSSPHQTLRRGKANGTLQFPWPWPSPPSSPLPQRCPLWSPWRPLPPAPRPRSSRRWAPSSRRPSSEEARAQTVCMDAGRAAPSPSSSWAWEDPERRQTDGFNTHPEGPSRPD